MKSQTSLWNKSLFNYFSGSVLWLSFVYLLASIIILPLSLWIMSMNIPINEVAEGYYDGVLMQTASVHIVVSGIYVVLMVLFMFNYKNNEDASDFIHSLPVKRKNILTHALIVGFLAMTVPVVITALILLLERYGLVFDISTGEVGIWLIYTLFVLYTVFSITTFTGFLVNKIFVHLQIVVLVFFLPLAFWGVTVLTANMFFDGISTSSFSGSSISLMEPVVNNTFPIFAVAQTLTPFILWKIVMWTAIAVILIILSYFLYGHRKNEYVHQTFPYLWVKDVLTALIAIIGMLAIGTLLSITFGIGSYVQFVFFALGLIISFIIIEMFFQSSVKLEFHLRTMLVTLAAVIVFWSLFFAGWSYYVNKMPERSDIESVYIETDGMYQNYYPYDNTTLSEYLEDDFMFISDDRFIDLVYTAHEYAKDHTVHMTSPEAPGQFSVTYKLDDGRLFSRTFRSLDETEEGRNIVNEVTEYNTMAENDLLNNVLAPDSIRELSITGGEQSQAVTLTDSEEIKQFIAEYKAGMPEVTEGYGPLVMREGAGSAVLSVTFGLDDYHETSISLYHPSVNKLLQDNDIDISEFHKFKQNDTMYTVELTDENRKTFFDDFDSESFSQIDETYDLKELSDEEKEEVVEKVNHNQLDSSAKKLVIYEINDYENDYNSNMDDVAIYTHNIIGIE